MAAARRTCRLGALRRQPRRALGGVRDAGAVCVGRAGRRGAGRDLPCVADARRCSTTPWPRALAPPSPPRRCSRCGAPTLVPASPASRCALRADHRPALAAARRRRAGARLRRRSRWRPPCRSLPPRRAPVAAAAGVAAAPGAARAGRRGPRPRRGACRGDRDGRDLRSQRRRRRPGAGMAAPGHGRTSLRDRGGAALSAAVATRHRDDCGLGFVATLPQARRQGHSRPASSRACSPTLPPTAARPRRSPQPPAAERLYRTLGFRELCRVVMLQPLWSGRSRGLACAGAGGGAPSRGSSVVYRSQLSVRVLTPPLMARRVTFSRNLTLSLSRSCQCYCKYCAFSTHQAHLHTPEEVERSSTAPRGATSRSCWC